MPRIYLLPNCVPCSVCSTVYPLSHYTSREWDPRPVVCEPCHKQMDRENMYEGPYVSPSDLAMAPFVITEVDWAFMQWMSATGKARCKLNLNDDHIVMEGN